MLNKLNVMYLISLLLSFFIKNINFILIN